MRDDCPIKGRLCDVSLNNAVALVVYAECSLDVGFKRNLTTILNEGSRVESDFSDDLVHLGSQPKLLGRSNSTFLEGTCTASGKGDVTVKVLSPVYD
jgi:hypothetical protein